MYQENKPQDSAFGHLKGDVGILRGVLFFFFFFLEVESDLWLQHTSLKKSADFHWKVRMPSGC